MNPLIQIPPINNTLNNQPGSPSGNNYAVNQAIPGFSGLTQSATSIIRNLMSGQPATSTARRANAYFGASSGMPGSDFVRNHGFDVYNQQGEQNQQRGFQDLLSLLSGYSGTVMPTTGQRIQDSQFGQDLNFRRSQADRDFFLQEQKRKDAMKPKTSGFVGLGPGFTGVSANTWQTPSPPSWA